MPLRLKVATLSGAPAFFAAAAGLAGLPCAFWFGLFLVGLFGRAPLDRHRFGRDAASLFRSPSVKRLALPAGSTQPGTTLYFRRMLERLVSRLALVGVFAGGVPTAGCAARAGSVPMAGYRNVSTTCVFGLRGVRIALEDEAPDALNVRLTMCSDLPALRQRTRAFLAKEGTEVSTPGAERGAREIQLGHERASASVEDIRGGVQIRVVPDKTSNVASIRNEIEARIARISTDNRCY